MGQDNKTCHSMLWSTNVSEAFVCHTFRKIRVLCTVCVRILASSINISLNYLQFFFWIFFLTTSTGKRRVLLWDKALRMLFFFSCHSWRFNSRSILKLFNSLIEIMLPHKFCILVFSSNCGSCLLPKVSKCLNTTKASHSS